MKKIMFSDDFCEVKRKCNPRAGSTPYASKKKRNVKSKNYGY